MAKTKEPIVIVGIGETAEMAADYFAMDSPFEVRAFTAEKAFLDKHPEIRSIDGKSILSLDALHKKFPPTNYRAFVAMAYGRLNHDRARMYQEIKRRGYELVSYVSSRAFVGTNVQIGENCFIMENNVLQRNVKIGNDVVLWSGNHIGHRTVIEDHVFLSSHVAVSGFCRIGAYSFLGINSCIGDHVMIAKNCFIGGGVTIMHDTKENEIYRVEGWKPERLSADMVFGFRG